MIEVANSALLEAFFGHWPDFHDAEVLALRLDMTDHRPPTLEIDFEVAEMSDEVDERGYFLDRQRVRTTLRFGRVARLRVDGVYFQNVVLGLHLEPAGPDDYDDVLGPGDPRARRRFRVWWSSSLGMAADFLCDHVEVVAAAPFARAK